MRVAVRADASTAIGLGHLARCLSLAQALRADGATVAFFQRAIDVDGAAAPHYAGFASHALAEGPLADPRADARCFVEASRGFSPHLVLVDHYGLEADWHTTVRAATGARIAVIDDLANRPLSPDLLIDQNPAADHAAKYRGLLPPGTPLCGGLSFALLDPVYATHPPPSWPAQVNRIGIFMGGTDPANHSAWVLDCLRNRIGWRGPVALAATHANPHLGALKALADQDPLLALVCDQPNLADFHASCDLQIGAGGGASWERCCLGVPTVALVCAENQRQSLQPLASAGAVLAVEAMAQVETEAAHLAAAVNRLLADSRLRASLRDKGRALVDGHGADRVARRLLALAAEQHLRLRPVDSDDAALLLTWRNDPSTRQSSHQSDVVAMAEHQAWLTRSLQSATRQLWVADLGGLPVGMLRADFGAAPQGGHEHTLSWTVAPALRGAGLGRAMVGLLANHLDGALHAEVKVGNQASLQIAQVAGFRLESTHQGTWHLRRPARRRS